jgi:hypothetical protein
LETGLKAAMIKSIINRNFNAPASTLMGYFIRMGYFIIRRDDVAAPVSMFAGALRFCIMAQ